MAGRCVDAVAAIAIFLVMSSSVHAQLNVIDGCWRTNPDWQNNRQQLAHCSVGYVGKMTNNIGEDVQNYVVTDPSDDPENPKEGTLRFAMTNLEGKVWVTFATDMNITLVKTLVVSSLTTIDGRGVNVHISEGAGLFLSHVSDVIIHGLHIHNIKKQGPGSIMGPGKKILKFGPMDGDAIRIVTSTKVWIDHNTLSQSFDGLVDVTRGSNQITISNNRFSYQDKVMLLGHDDGFKRDADMKVTVAFNHFGPDCNQRMPRIRHGYAHVVNNYYEGWGIYALGGSMNPSIKSQANLFIAPEGKKQITWDAEGTNFRSIDDVFENGASFKTTAATDLNMKPNYAPDQLFEVAPGTDVKTLTSSAGALTCPLTSTC